MELEILKSEVFKEVEKRSSLEASAHPEAFEQMWVSEYEGGFLDTYWIEGYTSVIQLFKRYIRNKTVTHTLTSYDAEERLTLSAEMPARYDDLLTGSITTDIKMMIAAHILSGWLSVKAPELADKYKEESAGYAEDLRLKLLHRTEPLRTMINKGNDQLILTQYEACDPCPEPRRNHGRHHECSPCHRS